MGQGHLNEREGRELIVPLPEGGFRVLPSPKLSIDTRIEDGVVYVTVTDARGTVLARSEHPLDKP